MYFEFFQVLENQKNKSKCLQKFCLVNPFPAGDGKAHQTNMYFRDKKNRETLLHSLWTVRPPEVWLSTKIKKYIESQNFFVLQFFFFFFLTKFWYFLTKHTKNWTTFPHPRQKPLLPLPDITPPSIRNPEPAIAPSSRFLKTQDTTPHTPDTKSARTMATFESLHRSKSPL